MPDFAVKLLPHSLTYSTPFNNHGNYIISLGQLTAWLAQKAESLGVEVFPGFAAAEAVFDEARSGQGRAHRRHGPRAGRQAGTELHPRGGDPRAAHGARGRRPRLSLQDPDRPLRARRRSLPADLRARLQGAVAAAPRARQARAHRARRSGWPADSHTYAGSFLYHLDNDRVYVGYIVGLDYQDPRLRPSRPSSSTRTTRA